MALLPVTREFTVDLTRPPARRFVELQDAMRDEALALAREGLALIGPVPHSLRRAFAALYERVEDPYREEMAAWGRALELSNQDALCLQHMYEIAQAGERLMLHAGGLLGCTAGVAHTLDAPLHLRTLDWPLPALSSASCVLRMRSHKQEFVVAGIAGMVGVLSGMVEGAYSVTINYAPPSELPGRGAPPTFLLRRVLECAQSYSEAVELLQRTQLAAPVFFTVCGARRGEACIIERTRRDVSVRPALDDRPLTQANLHVAAPFSCRNDITRKAPPESLFCSSDARRRELASRLSSVGTVGDMDELAALLGEAPIFNPMTHQAMAFRPGTGELRVFRSG